MNEVGIFRLRLRLVEREDLEWLLKYRNDPQLYANFNQPMPLSYAQQLFWYENEVIPKKTFAYIVYTGKNRIGYVALQNINWITRVAEVSHFVLPELNPDLAYYFHELILAKGFNNLNLNRIHSMCFKHNPVFERLKKLGFKSEGEMRQTFYKDGNYGDSYMIAVLKSDWLTTRKNS